MNGLWLIEMATSFRYIVNITKDDGEQIECSDCFWVAETGNRINEMLSGGLHSSAEVEDMGPGSIHRKSALISAFRWNHPIPTKSQ
jgi:hypothetical protein